jgi:hypothetical protein
LTEPQMTPEITFSPYETPWQPGTSSQKIDCSRGEMLTGSVIYSKRVVDLTSRELEPLYLKVVEASQGRAFTFPSPRVRGDGCG